MKIVAVSVGRPLEVQWRGLGVQTSIFETPPSHRVNVIRENIEDDRPNLSRNANIPHAGLGSRGRPPGSLLR